MMLIAMVNIYHNKESDLGPELTLSEDISNFIRDVANSFIKIDLVRFFHNNPSTIDTAENISLYIGRDKEKIKKGLKDLVGAGIVKKYERENFELYSYVDDRAKRELLEKFSKAYEDRCERLKIIAHVIREEKTW
ncbi:MAG: hypothetical protein Q8M92_03170 [Candidatus Subteraquimicrobiales bacterium]|nr:hypothetical protein [Candidatus Subteraquimicrobiales bacterium]